MVQHHPSQLLLREMGGGAGGQHGLQQLMQVTTQTDAGLTVMLATTLDTCYILHTCKCTTYKHTPIVQGFLKDYSLGVGWGGGGGGGGGLGWGGGGGGRIGVERGGSG